MTLLYYDPIFLQHETGSHPENAGRLRAVVDRLSGERDFDELVRPSWKSASIEQLSHVHSMEDLESIQSFVAEGGGQIERDTVVSGQSWNAACMASGAACDAVSRVLNGEDSRAFCLLRPPGHHAMQSHPMGFCLLNNVAVAARSAVEQHGLERVLIVDWDVHHGNGTQATFWDDPNVAFLSMHRFPFYPGTGDVHETGQGAGQGLTVNLPVRFGTTAKDQISRFRLATEKLCAKVKPELVLISAGFDSHRDDPVGSNGFESEQFSELTQIMVDVAKAHASGRIVSMLEGGYNPSALAESVEFHIRALHETTNP
ncbi:MAG: histone deacetylase family protein [Rubripirellula sp.]